MHKLAPMVSTGINGVPKELGHLERLAMNVGTLTLTLGINIITTNGVNPGAII